MSSTIGCTPERSSQDAWFEEFFSSEPTLDLRGDELTFTANESTLVFLDREVANPDRSLAGRVWTIDTIIDGPAATNFPVSEPATMEFAEAGTVDVFSGCNDQVFSYEIDGDTLAFTLVSTTGQACSGTAGELSGHVSEVLGDRVTFEIDAQRLTLTNGDVGLGATTD